MSYWTIRHGYLCWHEFISCFTCHNFKNSIPKIPIFIWNLITKQWDFFVNFFGFFAQAFIVYNLQITFRPEFIFGEITAQKMKFSIKDFFSKCDQIRRKLWICSHLLKKSLMENYIFFILHDVALSDQASNTLFRQNI